ncbi:hypothetical protein MP11Mi_31380 [Gordonia sp. MP11Mi]|uniref:Uncharacterized protein n=1 Tax=Gordonia sp. MP11Mi TaxID=3022769 RepID=A0AA97CZN3_9ACTN
MTFTETMRIVVAATPGLLTLSTVHPIPTMLGWALAKYHIRAASCFAVMMAVLVTVIDDIHACMHWVITIAAIGSTWVAWTATLTTVAVWLHRQSDCKQVQHIPRRECIIRSDLAK